MQTPETNCTSTRPRLLVIDDDPLQRELIVDVLEKSYDVAQAIDGESGIELAMRHPPELILLDVTMPGLSGLQVCRKLRENDATRAVPVIFLSALIQLEDRLAAYDAGGDDFLGKPFVPAELGNKVEATLRRVAERQCLLEEKQSAFATAMTALTTTSEIGAILNFLRQSFGCTGYESLAMAIIEGAAAWGLNVAVQLRGATGDVSRNHAGASSPLEAGVLGTLASCGRIATLGRRLAVNFDHVTLMAIDMPIDDPERNGRMRDNLAWLAEAADARVKALDNELALRTQRQALQRLVEKTGSALMEIENRRQLQKATALMHMQDMLMAMGRNYLLLGLTDEQEARIAEILNTGVDKVIGVFDEGLATDSHLREITEELTSTTVSLTRGSGA